MICIGLGYGVMVAQDILVVFVLVRARIAQPSLREVAPRRTSLNYLKTKHEETPDRDIRLSDECS